MLWSPTSSRGGAHDRDVAGGSAGRGPDNQPIVLLREGEEGNGGRYLPDLHRAPEATAIVYALQGMETPRPMTHDLFKTVLDELGVSSGRS